MAKTMPSRDFFLRQATLTACTEEWLLYSSRPWKEWMRRVLFNGPYTRLQMRIVKEFRKLVSQYEDRT